MWGFIIFDPPPKKKEEGEKKVKRTYWIHNVFRARENEGEFHTLFGRLKDDRKNFSYILEYFET